MTDDAELLRRYVSEHSEAAFAELVQRHLPLVYNAALRQLGGATHRAEDVTQTVFADLARKAATLSRRSHLGGWLYLSTHFAAAKLKRAEQRREIREQAAYLMNEGFSSGAKEVEWDQLRPVLDDAMVELNERDREVILLRFFENRSFGELGSKLGVSEDAARMRIDRALERLRALLAKRGIGSTSAAIGILLANQTVSAAPTALAATVTGSALASAAVVPTALTVIDFMSLSKIIGGAIGLALVFALGVATREIISFRTAHAILTGEQQRLAAAVQEGLELNRRLRSIESELASSQQKLAQGKAAVLAEETNRAALAKAAPSAAANDPVAAGYAFMAKHPEVKTALAEYASARSAFRFSALYETLHFTPAQIREFESLWGLGMGAWGPEKQSLMLTSSEDISPEEKTRRLNALLGQEGMRYLMEYSKTFEARDITANIAGALYLTEAPLTAEQAREMTRILSRNRTPRQSQQSVYYDWENILRQATSYLSAPQLAVLERMEAADRFTAALNSPPPGSETKVAPATSEK